MLSECKWSSGKLWQCSFSLSDNSDEDKKTTECWLTSNSHKAKSLKKTIKLYLSETSLRQSCNIVKYPQCTCWQLWKPYEKSISVTQTNSTVRWTAIRQAGWPSAGMKCYITILKTILEWNTAVYRQLCNSNFIIFLCSKSIHALFCILFGLKQKMIKCFTFWRRKGCFNNSVH